MDAIQEYLIKGDTTNNPRLVYASEADVINKVVFGMTAREFRANKPNLPKNKNMRDFATHQQLAIVYVLEAMQQS